MSRKLRKEIERNNLLAEELKEIERLKKQKEKIFAPLVWRHLDENNIQIQDLKPKYHDDVLKMIEDYYLKEEVLCRNTEIWNDPESKESIMRRIHFELKQQCSIIAMKFNDEGDEDRVVGVLVLKPMQQKNHDRVYARSQIGSGEAYTKCIKLLDFMDRKYDIYKEMDCKLYVQICQICIIPEYRKQGIGMRLLECSLNVSKTLKAPAIMGIFTNATLQEKAKKIGMQIVYEKMYVKWRDRLDEWIFDDPGLGNYSCVVMARKL